MPVHSGILSGLRFGKPRWKSHQGQSTIFGIIIAFSDFFGFDQELVNGFPLCFHQFFDPGFGSKTIGYYRCGLSVRWWSTAYGHHQSIHYPPHPPWQNGACAEPFLRANAMLSQVIKTKFVIGTISDVCIISLAAACRCLVRAYRYNQR